MFAERHLHWNQSSRALVDAQHATYHRHIRGDFRFRTLLHLIKRFDTDVVLSGLVTCLAPSRCASWCCQERLENEQVAHACSCDTIGSSVRNWLFVLAVAGAIVALAHFQSATLDEAVKESRREKRERLSAAVTPPPTTPEPTPAPTPQSTPEPTPAPTPVPKAVDSATRSTPRKGDSIGEWFEFWTGQPLTADVVPISAGTKIPNRIFMTWKTKDLP
jgi:hypothetical protein